MDAVPDRSMLTSTRRRPRSSVPKRLISSDCSRPRCRKVVRLVQTPSRQPVRFQPSQRTRIELIIGCANRWRRLRPTNVLMLTRSREFVNRTVRCTVTHHVQKVAGVRAHSTRFERTPRLRQFISTTVSSSRFREESSKHISAANQCP